MSPPTGVKGAGGSPNVPQISPSEERKTYLQSSEFFLDPSNSADPQHLQKKWDEDRDYRLKHTKLTLAMDAFNRFMNRDPKVSPARLQEVIDAWKNDPEFSKDPLNQVVLNNMHRILGRFETPDNAGRATETRGALPALPKPPEAAKPAVAAAKPEAKKDLGPPAGWRFNAITTNFHFADDTFRVVPSYLTLGLMPKEGFGQNQSSDVAISLGTEFSYKDFGFFVDGFYQDAKPLGVLNSASATLEDPVYNAKFGQAGIRFGMVEYADPLVGNRGEGGFFSLFGRTRVGIGLGAGWCQSTLNPDVKCSDTNFQLSTFNDGDFLSGGYGPMELGVRFLPLTSYLNVGKNGLPESNRLPMEFFASYHINPPYTGGKVETSEDVLKKNQTVGDAQVTMTGLQLFTNAIRFNGVRKTEAAYQQQRIISLGIDSTGSQYSLLNAGTMIGGLLSGYNEGAMAYRGQQQFRYGNTGQRIALGVMFGGELLADVIGLAATPGLPNETEYLNGEHEGITNLQARAFRLTLPTVAARDGLMILGSVGAFGDLNKAVQGDTGHQIWWGTTHGGLVLGGLVMVLTSGIGNGNGFFGRSILGNQPPNTDRIEIVGSDYDYPAQDGQFHRVSIGSAALSYGLNGLVELVFDKIKYENLRGKEAEKKLEDLEKKGGKPDPTKPQVQVGVSTDGKTGFNLSLNGTF
jgi:hypothetical protein